MIMKDQEEEICHLKEMLKDKDHIIHGLTKTSKLRRLVDSSTINTPYLNSDSISRKLSLRLGAVTPPLTSKLDKENFAEVKEFKSSETNALNFVFFNLIMY
ncbi:hypothetical protein QCA50_018203 [Cerrena zonata]|uniref:Uncharacterized protein n=1 Tax=Cerrena zonata TaxID=2478898 RepID=A0AAW0FMH2_9APHY